MCCYSKAALKGIQKWLGTHPTPKICNKSNTDIIDEIKQVLYLLFTYQVEL